MKGYLKSYRAILHTVGPVFVGSGKKIKRKEYMFLNGRKTVGVPDIQGLYAELKRRNQETAYEEYMLGQGDVELTDWLIGHGIRPEEFEPFLKYTLDCDGAIAQEEEKIKILECIKDAYGKPYIPGSSLKGMFRTILLGADIMNRPEKYQEKKDKLSEVGDSIGRSLLRGFIVSDSEPLSTDDLVLCREIARRTDGTEKKLPLMRECIKHGTDIRFTITIDTCICKWFKSDKSLMDAVERFMIENYYERFSKAFKGMDMPDPNNVLCGGGCGFVSKTIVYPMYGKAEGIEFAKGVFRNSMHGHCKDKAASPRTIKYTRCQEDLLQMGVCRLSMEETEMI